MLARRAAAAAFGRELALAAAGGLLYFLIRGAVVDRVEEAFARAEDVIALERSLGSSWERAMQEWILSSPLLIDLMNAVYFWLHMPLMIVVAVWLFWRHRDLYRLTRNAFLGAALIALVMYATLPLAPPRFFPELGFVDTMAVYSQANYQAQEAGPFVNPYAALPSLHFGWALLLGVASGARAQAGGRRRCCCGPGAAGAGGAALRHRPDGEPLPHRCRGRGGGRGGGAGGGSPVAAVGAKPPSCGGSAGPAARVGLTGTGPQQSAPARARGK